MGLETAKLLMEFSRCTGVAGMEGGVSAHARGLLENYGPVEQTPLGSLLCRVRAPREGEPHLLLDAHMDEIGMVVTHITDDGFLGVGACGGVDRRTLPASLVEVHTRAGTVTGVICSVPPHLSGDEDKRNQKVDEIRIDTGFSAEETRKRVRLGDRVTLRSTTRQLPGGLVTGKALDDRAGCVSLLLALEELREKSLGCGLSVQFSSMEEVGGQGARTAAWIANPSHAVAVDVSFAHTPDAKREKCGELRKGPMVGIAPVLDREISDKLTALAEAGEIPHQLEVMGGKTGTNIDSIVTCRQGVRCGLLSIPQRYMHTPIETVAVCDVENTGQLLAAFAGQLGKGGC